MKSKLFPLLFASLLAVGCSDPSVEIVEKDYSYKPDDRLTHVDIPERFPYDTINYVSSSFSSATESAMEMKLVNGAWLATTSELPISIGLKRPAKEAITFRLAFDASLLESYPTRNEGFSAIPEGAVASVELTIPAGQKSIQGHVRLTNPALLTQAPGYIGAMRLTAVNAPEDVKVLSDYSTLFFRVDMKTRNVTPVTEKPASWVAIGAGGITEASNWNDSDPTYGSIGAISDGVIGIIHPVWYFWVKPDVDHYIDLTFPHQRVTGLAIHSWDTSEGYDTFTGVTIQASEDGGQTWTPQGSVTFAGGRSTVYIAFDRPISADKLRLSSFLPENALVPLSEIEVFH